MCHPLYYDFPEFDEAYSYTSQYFFGDAMMAAPITTPIDSESDLARKTIWIPPGTWIEWFSGNRYIGPKVVDRTFSLDETPVYVKAGAIIPMQTKNQDSQANTIDPLVLTMFPTDSGSTMIYEDDGNSSKYMKNEFAETPVRLRRLDDRTLTIEIGPARGKFQGMFHRRKYELRIRGSWPPSTVTVNGIALGFSESSTESGYHYDGNTLTTMVSLPASEIRKKVIVKVKLPSSLDSPLLTGVPGILKRLKNTTAMLNHLWSKDWSPDILIEAAQTGNRITLAASRDNALVIQEELRKLQEVVPQLPSVLRTLEGDQRTINRALRHVSSIIQ